MRVDKSGDAFVRTCTDLTVLVPAKSRQRSAEPFQGSLSTLDLFRPLTQQQSVRALLGSLVYISLTMDFEKLKIYLFALNYGR